MVWVAHHLKACWRLRRYCGFILHIIINWKLKDKPVHKGFLLQKGCRQCKRAVMAFLKFLVLLSNELMVTTLTYGHITLN